MNTARWSTLGLLLALGLLPAVAASACGGGQNNGAGGDGGLGDGTVDGPLGDGTGSGSGSSSGGDGGGSLGEGGPCVPGCPADVQCGRYTDCTGAVLECGMACEAGTQCTPGAGGTQMCQANNCGSAEAGTAKCGEVAIDSCGVPINCPACPTGQTCVNNACVTQASSGDGGTGQCAPLTCTPGNVDLCGTLHDSCGNSLVCNCETGYECVGGLCQKAPPECAGDAGSDGGIGAKCGTVPNACGSGTVTCGDCAPGNQCVGGVCTKCTAPVCGTAKCGTVTTACGSVACGTCDTNQTCYEAQCCTPLTCSQAIGMGLSDGGCAPVNLGCGMVAQNCAGCSTGETCYDNACCTPSSCAAKLDAGAVTGCAPIDLGCGVSVPCQTCPTGQVCQGNSCVNCTPKTCADYANVCGAAAPDGCGNTLNCCTGGNVCTSNVCCQPGDVVYQGACCLPTCNTNLPTGPQVSCGEVIYCVQGTQ